MTMQPSYILLAQTLSEIEADIPMPSVKMSFSTKKLEAWRAKVDAAEQAALQGGLPLDVLQESLLELASVVKPTKLPAWWRQTCGAWREAVGSASDPAMLQRSLLRFAAAARDGPDPEAEPSIKREVKQEAAAGHEQPPAWPEGAKEVKEEVKEELPPMPASAIVVKEEVPAPIVVKQEVPPLLPLAEAAGPRVTLRLAQPRGESSGVRTEQHPRGAPTMRRRPLSPVEDDADDPGATKRCRSSADAASGKRVPPAFVQEDIDDAMEEDDTPSAFVPDPIDSPEKATAESGWLLDPMGDLSDDEAGDEEEEQEDEEEMDGESDEEEEEDDDDEEDDEDESDSSDASAEVSTSDSEEDGEDDEEDANASEEEESLGRRRGRAPAARPQRDKSSSKPPGPAAVLSAPWMQGDDSDDEDAGDGTQPQVGGVEASEMADENETEQSAKTKLGLREVCRFKEGAKMLKEFIAQASAVELGGLSPAVVAKMKGKPTTPTVSQRRELRLTQLRAYKAMVKLETLRQESGGLSARVFWKASSIAQKFVLVEPLHATPLHNPIAHTYEQKELLRQSDCKMSFLIRGTKFDPDSASLVASEDLFLSVRMFLARQLSPLFVAFKKTAAWEAFVPPADLSSDLSEVMQEQQAKAKAGDDDTDGALSSGAAAADAPSAADSFADYEPAKLDYGPPHVEHVVESASLACVSPTDITYTPKLPAEALSSGVLSRVQLEAVVYALQQHERMLPDGKTRAGFFIGDGTGVGKGRELAAIIWENWLQGRRRAVWFTCNTDLLQDARRDLDDIGARHIKIESLTALSYGAISKHLKEGVLLVTYSCLVAKSVQGGQRVTRMQQLEEWLRGASSGGCGSGFDGVLAFDEAHKAKGAANSQPVGTAVVSLQHKHPLARVVYLSATGATAVQDMSYMERLGLWGSGTYFKAFDTISAVLNGGGSAGAMEMLAVQLKSSGAYLARNLGMRGVDFHLETAKLSAEQELLYDRASRLWLKIYAWLSESEQRGWQSTYTAALNKFFQQLILSFKVPEICRHTRRALRAGKCVVIGLQSTGDAATTKATTAGSSGGGGKRATLVSAAYEALEGMLDKLEQSMARSSSGIEARLFAGFRTEISSELDMLSLPPTALDALIDYFGAKHVAEMTGRSHRLQRAADSSYALVSRAERGVPLSEINLKERERFQRGEKLIAILSDAGATGVSLHADKSQFNHRRRYHIVPELGWSASKIVQQFGRTHRTNQLMPPEYVLLTCESAGESLTGSAVARKLEGLGALTKGDRSAGRGETGGLGANLEGKAGQDALAGLTTSFELRTHLFTGKPGDDDLYHMLLRAENVKQFLTRLQLVPLKRQQGLLRAFLSKVANSDNARASQLVSNSIKISQEEVVFSNPRNPAEKVTITEIECDHSCSWDAAVALVSETEGWITRNTYAGFWQYRSGPGAPFETFAAIPLDDPAGKTGRVRLCYPHHTHRTKIPVRWFDPVQGEFRRFGKFSGVRGIQDAQREWKRLYDNALKYETHMERFALMNGSVFSIWHNVRQATDPSYDAAKAQRDGAVSHSGLEDGRTRSGRRVDFEPNVKIQLVTASDGRKLGGIRLDNTRPMYHPDGVGHLEDGKKNEACNRVRFGDPFAYCRKHACLRAGYSQVDKLKVSLRLHTRQLHDDDKAAEAASAGSQPSSAAGPSNELVIHSRAFDSDSD